MEASIKDHNIKTFVRLLQCASKFGDDLNMNATRDVWELAVTNSTKSAFFLAKLRPKHGAEDGFFFRYKTTGSPVQQRRGVKCVLLVKSVLSVIGKVSSASNVERLDFKIINPQPVLAGRHKSGGANGTSSLEIEYGEAEEVDTGITTKLEIKIVCKHGVVKKHSLHVGATEFLRAEVDPNTTPSTFTLPARTLRDWLDHFSVALGPGGAGSSGPVRGESQLGWSFGKNEVRVKSWEGGAKELSTEIRVDKGEFDEYWVEEDKVELALPVKEFRATLQLAESLGIDITAAFSEAGQPLTLTSDKQNLEEAHFDIFCAIATTTCDAFASNPPANGANGGDNKPKRSGSSVITNHPSRNGSVKAEEGVMRDGPEQAEGSGSRKRKASESAPASGRARSRLSLSDAAPPAASGGIVSVSAMEEPLFLPLGSQEDDPAEVAAGPAIPGGSQSKRLTQKEIMDLSGFDIDANQLAEELDELEEEEYRASQVPQGPAGDEDMEAQQAAAQDQQDRSVDFGMAVGMETFEADLGIFAEDQGVRRDDGSKKPPPGVSAGDGEDEGEFGEDEEDSGPFMGPTQDRRRSHMAADADNRSFTSFFDD